MATIFPNAFNVRDDVMPGFEDQAGQWGWKASLFSFGKAEKDLIDYFNPSIVERKDGLWLLVRRSIFEDRLRFGRNSIMAFKLGGADGISPLHGMKLRIPFTNDQEQFEDPRAIYHDGHTWVGACNFVWYGTKWTGAHQILAACDDNWEANRYDPDYGKNGMAIGRNTGHEKNWLWFFHKNRLHMVYAGPPDQQVVEFTSAMQNQAVHLSKAPCPWPHGVIRGGTPPVLVDNEYWTFFHSSMPWRPPFRRYFMGAYAFEAKPPFRPTRITGEALLIGSQNDYWQARKPLVVFPCGAILKAGRNPGQWSWFITLGINDLKCGWVEIPHDDLLLLTEEL